MDEIVSRCERIPGVDKVVVAFPDTKKNDPLHRFVGWAGPEDDVLARYVGAALYFNADIVMRITGDCPLISPELCGAVLKRLKRSGADYASNIEPRTFPKGLDCEVFTIETLERAHREDKEREHVTTWMRSAKIKRVSVVSPWPMDGRLCLDTEDDYKTICAAFGHEPYQRLRAA